MQTMGWRGGVGSGWTPIGPPVGIWDGGLWWGPIMGVLSALWGPRSLWGGGGVWGQGGPHRTPSGAVGWGSAVGVPHSRPVPGPTMGVLSALWGPPLPLVGVPDAPHDPTTGVPPPQTCRQQQRHRQRRHREELHGGDLEGGGGRHGDPQRPPHTAPIVPPSLRPIVPAVPHCPLSALPPLSPLSPARCQARPAAPQPLRGATASPSPHSSPIGTPMSP